MTATWSVDLGDDEGLVIEHGRGPTYGLDIGRVLDKGLADGVRLLLGGEFQEGIVLLRESSAMFRRWPSRLPWAKFRRATLMPERVRSVRISGESEAGPMVQTILVLRRGYNVIVNNERRTVNCQLLTVVC